MLCTGFQVGIKPILGGFLPRRRIAQYETRRARDALLPRLWSDVWNRVITLEFAHEGQTSGIHHAVQIQDAIEVIAFVLYDGSRELGEACAKWDTVTVEGFQLDLGDARHDSPKIVTCAPEMVTFSSRTCLIKRPGRLS